MDKDENDTYKALKKPLLDDLLSKIEKHIFPEHGGGWFTPEQVFPILTGPYTQEHLDDITSIILDNGWTPDELLEKFKKVYR
jgi:hypothetical protein